MTQREALRLSFPSIRKLKTGDAPEGMVINRNLSEEVSGHGNS